ncbi:MAG: type II secretion system GspH family protein [Holosporales bacterium]|jgi:hypothetical protein|nr:type II secretion system GspH family protein [Holosporales bacterium]
MRKVTGFVLLELAIALCVIGAIGSVFLPLIKVSALRKKQEKTNQSFENVFSALSAYFAKNHRLPFAGENGVEVRQKFIGEVPYKDLFLEKQAASDGEGNVLLYIVDKKIVFATPRTELSEKDEEDEGFSQDIKIIGEDGESQIPLGAIHDFCAVVLISRPSGCQANVAGGAESNDDEIADNGLANIAHHEGNGEWTITIPSAPSSRVHWKSCNYFDHR